MNFDKHKFYLCEFKKYMDWTKNYMIYILSIWPSLFTFCLQFYLMLTFPSSVGAVLERNDETVKHWKGVRGLMCDVILCRGNSEQRLAAVWARILKRLSWKQKERCMEKITRGYNTNWFFIGRTEISVYFLVFYINLFFIHNIAFIKVKINLIINTK